MNHKLWLFKFQSFQLSLEQVTEIIGSSNKEEGGETQDGAWESKAAALQGEKP